MKHLYESYINSKIDFVKFVKDFSKSNKKADKLDKLNKLDLDVQHKNITKNEKLLIYLFCEKILIEESLFLKECAKCKFEWFSTQKDAKLCEQCR